MSNSSLEAIIAAARQKVLERQQQQVTSSLVAPSKIKDMSEHFKDMEADEKIKAMLHIQAPTSCFVDETWPDAPIAAQPEKHLTLQSDAAAFDWNPEQLKAIELARSGKSFCLIGAAGTGKTTTLKAIMQMLIAENRVPILRQGTKYLQHGLPGICLTSFTRRAVRNIKKAVSKDIGEHCITTHKLLEYAPIFYEVQDPETGDVRNTMRFEPTRNKQNKLPADLRCIVEDESSMKSVDLFKQETDALPEPSKVQFIFLGDLHQLPPVYGQAILGFKLLDLPTVELTRIYRQAQESPIIALAHKIKDGLPVPVVEKQIIETPRGKITLHPWKKKISDFDAAHTVNIFLRNLITEGHFDEEEDIILCPQEKTKNLAFGTNEFNRQIAQTLGERRGAEVYEVIAGYNKHYFAVGDRILVDREDAVITKISKNARYWGTRPRTASIELDRWGNYKSKVSPKDEEGDDFDVDKMLDSFSLEAPDEDRKQEASHTIEVELLDSGATEVISTAGEINGAQFAYCLTVHKSQGSEWRRVFFFTHESHRMMWSRELLYTAITRAREELYMIVEPDKGTRRGTLNAASQTPRIKGDTLAEKAEYFKGKRSDYEDKLKFNKDDADAEFHASKSAPKKKESIIIAAPSKPPVKLVRLHELISEEFKREANRRLNDHWRKALGIWGNRIGQYPVLDFNLQRSAVIGLAQLKERRIKLNSLWCLVAETTPQVKQEMLEDTLIHEVCHMVAYEFSGDRGHGTGWTMAMKLMGVKPSVYAEPNALPSWIAMYQAVLKEKQEQAKAKGADIAEDTIPLNPTDEV